MPGKTTEKQDGNLCTSPPIDKNANYAMQLPNHSPYSAFVTVVPPHPKVRAPSPRHLEQGPASIISRRRHYA